MNAFTLFSDTIALMVQHQIPLTTDFVKAFSSYVQQNVKDSPQRKVACRIEAASLAAANKIGAIKIVRQYTGMGLAETKSFVEGMTTIDISENVLTSINQEIRRIGYLLC